MKYRCIIVDDEPLAIDILAVYLENLDDFQLVKKCRNAMEAYPVLHEGNIDLIFLDIRMPKISGMELAKSLMNPPKIIFTTASSEFAAESYETTAIDYLIKPISYERFLKAIYRFIPSYQPKDQGITSTEQSFIFIKADNKVYKVRTDKIRYIESFKDYIKIHQNEAQAIISYQSISNIEKALPARKFLRVHRSFIINQDHIIAYSSNYIDIDKNEIPIGRTYKETVRKVLDS